MIFEWYFVNTQADFVKIWNLGSTSYPIRSKAPNEGWSIMRWCIWRRCDEKWYGVKVVCCEKCVRDGTWLLPDLSFNGNMMECDLDRADDYASVTDRWEIPRYETWWGLREDGRKSEWGEMIVLEVCVWNESVSVVCPKARMEENEGDDGRGWWSELLCSGGSLFECKVGELRVIGIQPRCAMFAIPVMPGIHAMMYGYEMTYP